MSRTISEGANQIFMNHKPPQSGEVWQHFKGNQYVVREVFVAERLHWPDTLCLGAVGTFYACDLIKAGDRVVLYSQDPNPKSDRLYGRTEEGFLETLASGVNRFERVR